MIMIGNICIGIDICDVEKFREIPFKSKPGFYKKLFNDSEIKYCLKYKNHFEHFAAKFAIKEATVKSIQKKLSLLDIETLHIKKKPTIRIRENTEYSFMVSVSHDAGMAVAVVLSFSK